MKCQYCDSIIKPVPDNGICPNCGGVLGEEEQSNRKALTFPEPPVGFYKSGLGYMEIGDNYVKLFTKYPHRIIDRTIPFNDIGAVCFIPNSGLNVGFVCVRTYSERTTSMPKTYREAISDKSAVTFNSTDCERFYGLYVFLKKCADIVNGTE